MALAKMNVTLREATGKGAARKLRANDLVPAVVYGKGMNSCAITFEPKALQEAVSGKSGWNTLITLKGDAAVEGKVVVLKDLELHPLRRTMVCADFHAIDLKKKVNFMVPVVPVGTSLGEKEGGSLQVIRHELEVYCLPTAVPQSIEIDVTAMNIGDVVHIEEVAVPEGAEIPFDVNFTVLTVKGMQAEEELDEDEETDETADVSVEPEDNDTE